MLTTLHTNDPQRTPTRQSIDSNPICTILGSSKSPIIDPCQDRKDTRPISIIEIGRRGSSLSRFTGTAARIFIFHLPCETTRFSLLKISTIPSPSPPFHSRMCVFITCSLGDHLNANSSTCLWDNAKASPSWAFVARFLVALWSAYTLA